MEPLTAVKAEKVKVTFLPKETSTRVPAGTTLFHAAAWTGQPIESTCGGRGTCGKCRVQVIQGTAPVTPADLQHLAKEDLAGGWRLSCQSEVRDEMVVQVPRLLSTPKTAMFGVGRQVLLDPNVHKVHLMLAEPTLHDQRSDLQRLKEALRQEGFAMNAELPVVRTLPKALRDSEFDVTAVVCGESLLAVEPGDTTGACFGIAFDLGTTTIVGTLMDLNNGEARGVTSNLNAQAIHGGDVLSRISHTMGKKEGLQEMQHFAAFTMNGIVERLTAESGVPLDRIYEITVAGNLTMMHLLLGIDPEPISVTPFAPAVSHGLNLRAADLGITVHPEGRVFLFPAIGSYVGGDIVAGLLATALPRGNKLRLFVDVGTNGEIALGSEPRTLSTAAPAGPAFEGAEISCGMRATTGAIEGVQVTEDSVVLQTIQDAPPVGLCGSGLIDAVAQLYKRGLMDATGRMRSAEELQGQVPQSLASRLVTVDGVRAFVLATEEETGGKRILFSQKDVRQLQFAKGSIASGIRVLMKEMGVAPEELQEVLLAGAFGSYIHPDAARIIGLVPAVPLARIRAVGNAAGEGAKIALLSYREREAAEAMPARVEYIELSGREDFNDIFMSVLGFPPLDSLP
ncbi:MAG TPA: ASKHA domain-containing protein [Candidatus Polarisedimenticolia bacterium]|jgi:uncharacterized 2Fe-2S/4Fe-4S cluster protein (DUF4445 family)|nr:ASKHA domain-containing protein [Candidatus Polarisedimenticolia bacterium]